jgi:transposase-like protein
MVGDARTVVDEVRNGKTVEEAARAVGVDRHTLALWKREEVFRYWIRRAKTEGPSEPRCYDLNAYADAPTGPPPLPGTPDSVAEAAGWVRLR